MNWISISSILLVLIGGMKHCAESKNQNANQDSPKYLGDPTMLSQFVDENATTFILVRHAEKMKTKDPSLTEEGKLRSKTLNKLLEHTALNAVYSSDYNRTKETATPTAERKNLELEIYDPSDLSTTATNILKKYERGKILMVGHSNTTPAFLNYLSGTDDFEDIDETVYDDLFVVVVHQIGNVKVHHFKYGDISP